MAQSSDRRLAIGAEQTSGRACFRVWAPEARRLRLVFPDQPIDTQELTREPSGYFFANVALCNPDRHERPLQYQFQIDGQAARLPDPASRFQPLGPTGPSELVDPAGYAWQDRDWRGPKAEGHVFYELHVGTFTREGTWNAAREQLAALAELGVTVLEIMPISEFAGRFGWSYDPVNLFAPHHGYGTPTDLRRFVDEAHRLGIAVILDVVYNHFSRLGERLLQPFSAHYFSNRHQNEWGRSPNFDDEHSADVRQFFLANVTCWISEYHFDGLRIDAMQAFFDDSKESILLDLARTARRAADVRRVLIVGENEPQHAELLRDEAAGGLGYDLLWNDDFHHSAMVRLTGQREAYYTDYTGSAAELAAGGAGGFCSKANATPGRKRVAARPRSICQLGNSSTSCKTMISLPTRPRPSGSIGGPAPAVCGR